MSFENKGRSEYRADKKAIKDNANPNKWKCVTAEAAAVESNGSDVILIMADTSEASALKTALLSLTLD